MKTTHLAIILLIALNATSVFAADFSSIKSAPVATPAPSWTGFYAGLNAGGSWSNSSATSVSTYSGYNNYRPNQIGYTYSPAAAWMASRALSSGYAGFIGGGQFGYQWQAYQNIVIGTEADIQGIAGSGSRSENYNLTPRAKPDLYVFGLVSTSRNISYLGTVRGKVGYLINPELYVYGTGGLAYGGVSSSISFSGAPFPPTGASPFFSNGNYSESRSGWAVGGGAEWLFVKDLSAKIEYLYYDLGNVSYSPNPSIAFKESGDVSFVNWSNVQTRFNGNVLRLGINYHFTWGSAPVVAKF